MNEDITPLAPINALPRISLREKAFKKYERYIARALNESYTLDPFEVLNLRAHSFVHGFKDAILGFRRYGYESILIPKSQDFRMLRLFETSDGMVSIVNLNAAAVESKPKILHAGKDFSAVKLIAHAYHLHKREDETFVEFSTDVEEKQVLDLAQPIGEYDITIKRHAPGILVLRQ